MERTLEYIIKVATEQAKSTVQQFTNDAKKALDNLGKVDLTLNGNQALTATKQIAQGFDLAQNEAKALYEVQKKVLASMQMAGQAGTKEFSEATAQLRLLRGEAEKFDKALHDADPGAFAEKMRGVGSALSSIAGPLGLLAGGFSLNAILAPTIEMDKATASIRTLGGAAKEIAPTLAEMSMQMSKEMPIPATEIAKASYDALSAGIKATKEDMSSFMDAAGKLAVGGQESIGNTTNLLSSLLNAYGASAKEATAYSDALFNTVNLGKTTIPELNANLSNVIPTAAAMGYNLRDVGAALALMTANGIPTAQATTKLNQLMIEIQKPGAALEGIFAKAGISVEKLGEKIKSGNAVGALQDVKDAFQKAGVSATQAFSSSEAGAAFNTLTKDMDKLREFTDSFGQSSGATGAAFNEMAQSASGQFAQLKATLETTFIGLGEKVLPSIVSAAKAIVPVISFLGDTFEKNSTSIGLITGALVLWRAQTIATTGVQKLLGSGILDNIRAKYADIVATQANTAATTGGAAATGMATKAVNMLKAAFASNPFGMAVLAITGLIVAGKQLYDMFTVTTEEQLANNKASQEMVQTKITETQKTLDDAKAKKALIDEYIKLEKTTKRTGEEEKRHSELQDEIKKKYPGVIKDTGSLAESMKSLEGASSGTANEINRLMGNLDKYNKQQRELVASNLKLTGKAAIETATDELKSALSLFDIAGVKGLSGPAWTLFRKLRDEFETSYDTSNVDGSIKKLTELQNAIYGSKDLKDAQDKQKVMDALAKAVNSLNQLKEFRAGSVVSKEDVDNAEDLNKELDKIDDKQKPTAEDAEKKLQQIEKERLATLKANRDKELSELQLKFAEEERTRKLEEISKTSQDELEEKMRLLQVQQKYNDLLKNAVPTLKTDEGKKEGEKFIDEFNKGIAEAGSGLEDVYVKVLIDDRELNAKLRDETIKNLQSKLKASWDANDFETAIKQRTTLISLLKDEYNYDVAKAKIAGQNGDELKRLNYERQAAEALLNLTKETNNAQYDAEFKALQDINSMSEQEYQKGVLLAKIAYNEEIANANESVALILAARAKLYEESKKLEDEFRSAGPITSALETLQGSFINKEYKARSDEQKRNFEEEERNLQKSYKNKQISSAEYASKMNELEKAQQKQSKIQWDLYYDEWRKTAVDTFRQIYEDSIKKSQELTEKIGANRKITLGIEKESTNAEIEMHKAYNEGRFDDAQKYYDQVVSLAKQQNTISKQTTQFELDQLAAKAAAYGSYYAMMIDSEKKLGRATIMTFLKVLETESIMRASEAIMTAYGTKDPILATISSAAAATAIALALATARSAAKSINFSEGTSRVLGEGTRTSDSVPANLSVDEAVLTARAADGHRDMVDFMNKGRGSALDYFLKTSGGRQALDNEMSQMRFVDLAYINRHIEENTAKMVRAGEFVHRNQRYIIMNHNKELVGEIANQTARLEKGLNDLRGEVRRGFSKKIIEVTNMQTVKQTNVYNGAKSESWR